MKKLTDKERLDWLRRSKANLCHYDWSGWDVHSKTIPENIFGFKSPRQAIDAAIRAEKKGAK